MLYVNPAAERGGGEVILLNVLRFLPKHDFRAEVVLLAQGPLAAELRASGVRTYVLPAGRFRQPWHLLRTLGHLARLAQRRNIALIESAGAKGHLYGGLAAWLTGVPAVWRLQDLPTPREPWTRLAGLMPSAGIVALSRASLAAYARLRRLPARTAVVYPGVQYTSDTVAHGPDAAVVSSVRDEFGVSIGTAVVTMVGRLQRWKGQHVFLVAAARVLKDRHDVHFLVVGGTMFGLEPDYERELKDLAERTGITDRVTFTGQRDDVARLLAATDVLVHASITPEPFGQVIVEGMAQGKAVVATAAGGPLEIITNGVDGVLVPPDDPAALSAALVSLLDDPPRRARLGAAAQRTVQDRFTVEAMAAGFARFYDDVLGSRARANGSGSRGAGAPV